jgi:hypothetical protein
MEHQTPSSENSIWTWIILGALLILGALTAFGALAITSVTQQTQMPTGSQSVPGH